MGKKIIFIDVTKARKNCCDIIYNDDAGNALYIEYWKTDSVKSGVCYLVDDTVIFSKNSFGEIWVRSRKYKAPINLSSLRARLRTEEGLLYSHISEAFKIFDDINVKEKDPVWMLEFDLNDTHISKVLMVALVKLFHSFALNEPTCGTAITVLYRDYHPSALYNMMVKNLTKRDHEVYTSDNIREDFEAEYGPAAHEYSYKRILKELEERDKKNAQIIMARGSGKTALMQTQLYRMMLNSMYGIKMGGKSNMRNTVINFRKDLEYFRRSSANTNCWEFKLKNTCEGYHQIYKIEIQGAGRKLKPADSTKEDLMIIAEQMVHDGFSKVIFNPKEKLTIIFPESFWMRKDYYSEKYVVKAHGDDQWDMIKGYAIAKAKAYSNDGYDWMNKLLRSGKVKW